MHSATAWKSRSSVSASTAARTFCLGAATVVCEAPGREALVARQERAGHGAQHHIHRWEDIQVGPHDTRPPWETPAWRKGRSADLSCSQELFARAVRKSCSQERVSLLRWCHASPAALRGVAARPRAHVLAGRTAAELRHRLLVLDKPHGGLDAEVLRFFR